MTRGRMVTCPQCSKQVEWGPASPYRPFCSERCKQIDLGAWASEAYRVPVTEDAEKAETEDTDPDRF